MTLTIYPASHPARPLMSQANHSLTSDHLFQASCPKEHKKSTRILRTSFNDLPTNGQDDVANTTSIILSSHNGFVRAAWDAYAHHVSKLAATPLLGSQFRAHLHEIIRSMTVLSMVY